MERLGSATHPVGGVGAAVGSDGVHVSLSPATFNRPSDGPLRGWGWCLESGDRYNTRRSPSQGEPSETSLLWETGSGCEFEAEGGRTEMASSTASVASHFEEEALVRDDGKDGHDFGRFDVPSLDGGTAEVLDQQSLHSVSDMDQESLTASDSGCDRSDGDEDEMDVDHGNCTDDGLGFNGSYGGSFRETACASGHSHFPPAIGNGGFFSDSAVSAAVSSDSGAAASAAPGSGGEALNQVPLNHRLATDLLAQVLRSTDGALLRDFTNQQTVADVAVGSGPPQTPQSASVGIHNTALADALAAAAVASSAMMTANQNLLSFWLSSSSAVPGLGRLCPSPHGANFGGSAGISFPPRSASLCRLLSSQAQSLFVGNPPLTSAFVPPVVPQYANQTSLVAAESSTSATSLLSGGNTMNGIGAKSVTPSAAALAVAVSLQQAEAVTIAAVVDAIVFGQAAAIVVNTGTAQRLLQSLQAHPHRRSVPTPTGVESSSAEPTADLPLVPLCHQYDGGGGNTAIVQPSPCAHADAVLIDDDDDYDDNGDEDYVDDDLSLTEFDGKHSRGILAVAPKTLEERRFSRAIHRAAETDDGVLVASVLQSCPVAPRMLADDELGYPFTGDVPAHVAARRGHMTALKRLLEEDKDSALIRNLLGHTCCHQAVEHGHFAAVQAACTKAPICARVQCEEGYLPLHDVTSSGARHQDAPQIAAALLSIFPGAVNVTTDEGLLPIHLAAMSGFTAGIRTIFGYSFETIQAKDNTELMLALDFATDGLAMCTGGRDGTEASSLDPTQTGSNDVGGSVDVHHEVLSVARQQPPTFSTAEDFEACIEILLMSALYNRPIPMPRDEGDDWPFLPIHAAIHARPLQRTWRFVFSYYGNHVADIDINGQTPLHYLAVTATRDEGTNVAMINYLNSLYPDAASLGDKDGALPLHHASMNPRSTFRVIRAILDCYGAAATVEIPNRSKLHQCRGFLPFQIAASTGLGVDVITMLLRTHPMGVKSGIR